MGDGTCGLEKPAPPPIVRISYELLHTVVGPPGPIMLHDYALQVLACMLKDPMGILSVHSIQLFESESSTRGTNNPPMPLVLPLADMHLYPFLAKIPKLDLFQQLMLTIENSDTMK